MAKSPAERKAAQRQRQQEAGVTKIELLVDTQIGDAQTQLYIA